MHSCGILGEIALIKFPRKHLSQKDYKLVEGCSKNFLESNNYYMSTSTKNHHPNQNDPTENTFLAHLMNERIDPASLQHHARQSIV